MLREERKKGRKEEREGGRKGLLPITKDKICTSVMGITV